MVPTYLEGVTSHTKPRAVTTKTWGLKRKCLKAVPRDLQNHVVWSRTLECSVKSYVTGPSIKCYFKCVSIHAGPHIWYNRINQWLSAFIVPLSLGFVLGLPPRGGFFESSPSDHDTWFIWCHADLHPSRIHILRWSLKRSVKRPWTMSVFSTNESAWSVRVMGSQSRVWSGPYKIM